MPQKSKLPEAVNWLTMLLAAVTIVALGLVYVFWQPNSGNRFGQLIIAVIPSVIATLLAVMAVYIVLVRKGISYPQPNPPYVDHEKLAQRVSEEIKTADSTQSTTSRNALSVKGIVEGEHYYSGTIIVLLEKSSTIVPEQLLTLCVQHDESDVPICLIKVDGFTTADFPQAIVTESLTDQELGTYLGDPSRHESLIAKPEITWRQLQWKPME